MRVSARASAFRRPRDEAGFTVVEVVIAALVLVIGGLAVFSLISAAIRNNYRSEQSQVVNDQLQQELEKVKQLPYAQVALTSLPTHSTDAANPSFRVSGTQFNVNRTGSPANFNLVYNGGHSNETGGSVSGGAVAPTGSFHNGSVNGQIYRYVVWQPATACSNCAHDANSDFSGSQRVPWVKHVVVAIALDQTASGGVRAYQEVQGDLGNPDEGQGSGSPGSCTSSCNNSTPWTFWLTDTPCNNTTRQPIAGDHLTHDTLGVCSKGMTTGPPGLLGANAGAPDLMFTQATPCAGNDCTAGQPLYDYATDVEPAQNADQDKGLQERDPTNVLNGGAGCLTDLSGLSSLLSLGSDPEWYIHKWVSNTIPTGLGSIVLDGTGNLNLWTQTIDNGVYNGRICVWLFMRNLNGLGVPVDTFAVSLDAHDECNTSRTLALSLTYFQCSMSSWPHGGWTEIHIPLHFLALTVPPNYRVGLAVAVERQGTLPGGGLQFIYDHPTYDSRLVIDTHSLLPSGLSNWP
jgi:Tfp pilus assembly protein PilV